MKFIEESEIWKATQNGLSIFEYYFPDAGKHLLARKHFKARSDEKTPSAFLFKGTNDLIYLKDFGSSDKAMSPIAYVMREEALLYIDALHFIQNVIIKKDLSGSYKKPIYKALYSKKEAGPNDKRGNYTAEYHPEIPQKVLEILGRYVTQELCDRFSLRSVRKYELVGYDKKENKPVIHVFESTEDYPILEYDYGVFKKIYKPIEPDKKYRFFYVGEKPADYIYGLKQLESTPHQLTDDYKDGEDIPKEPHLSNLIRVSGETDALNIASLGYSVYWLNSETAEMKQSAFNHLNKMAKNHFQMLDLDATGQAAAKSFGLKHLDVRTIVLPESLGHKKDFRGNPCKDARDYVNTVGKDQDATESAFRSLILDAFPFRFWDRTEKKGTEDGYEIRLNLESLYRFLNANGYYTIASDLNKQGYAYAKIENKLVDYIDIDSIKKHVKGFLKAFVNREDFYMRTSHVAKKEVLLNKINTSNQINESNLQDLPMIQLKTKNYTQHSEMLIFNNAACQITKDEITQVKLTDLPNYAIREGNYANGKKFSQVIDGKFSLLPADRAPVKVEPTPEYLELWTKLQSAKSEEERDRINTKISAIPQTDRFVLEILNKDHMFIAFMRDISRLHWRKVDEKGLELTELERKEESLNFINLMYILGYMIAQYKDPAFPKLVLLQDSLVSQVGASSGRSGKSLLVNLIKRLRVVFDIQGRDKKNVNENQFIYDGFTRFHDIVNIDDLHEYADFDRFYTEITGTRTVNGKHANQFTLEYPDSGKMIITSNFPLRNTDSSTMARILPAQVSDYYHEWTKRNDYKETRSPFSKYGKRLFDDFTETEWNVLFNFIAYCIQFFKKYDVVLPPMGNIEKRQLRLEMAKGLGSKDEEFLEWAEDTFHYGLGEEPKTLNQQFDKQVLFESFTKTLTFKQAREYKITTFKRALIAFCEYKGYIFNPQHLAEKPEEYPGKRRIVRKVEGQTKEFICIATPEFGLPITAKEKEVVLAFIRENKEIDFENATEETRIQFTKTVNHHSGLDLSVERIDEILKRSIDIPF